MRTKMTMTKNGKNPEKQRRNANFETPRYEKTKKRPYETNPRPSCHFTRPSTARTPAFNHAEFGKNALSRVPLEDLPQRSTRLRLGEIRTASRYRRVKVEVWSMNGYDVGNASGAIGFDRARQRIGGVPRLSGGLVKHLAKNLKRQQHVCHGSLNRLSVAPVTPAGGCDDDSGLALR